MTDTENSFYLRNWMLLSKKIMTFDVEELYSLYEVECKARNRTQIKFRLQCRISQITVDKARSEVKKYLKEIENATVNK